MVLVHGFIKKTQQTPKQDLELARKRMKEIRHAKEKHAHRQPFR